jgi:hypothetical protein
MRCQAIEGNTIEFVEANHQYIEIPVEGCAGAADLSGYSASFSYRIAGRKGLKVCQIQGNTLTVEMQAGETLGLGGRSGRYEARVYKEDRPYTVILGVLSIVPAVDPRLAPPDAEEVFVQQLAGAELRARTLPPGSDATASAEFGGGGQVIVTLGIPQGEKGESGKGGPPIDDASIGKEAPWSSKNTVDRLCPALDLSGGRVVCHPVEGYPLDVASQIEAVYHLDWVRRTASTTQTGAPSPETPAPLTDDLAAGTYSVPATDQPGSYWQVVLEEDLGGVPGCQDAAEVDGYTGRSRIVRNTGRIVLDGTEAVNQNVSGNYTVQGFPKARDNGKSGICSHFPFSFQSVYVGTNGAVYFSSKLFESVEAVKEYLAAQYEAGTPVTIRYGLASPEAAAGQCVRAGSAGQGLGAVPMGLREPDPDHPCAATGWEGVTMVHSSGGAAHTYTAGFPETVYDGELDWRTGVLTVRDGEGSHTVQLEARQILGLPGENILHSDTGATAVRGRSDPVCLLGEMAARLEGLDERVQALENAAVSSSALRVLGVDPDADGKAALSVLGVDTTGGSE